MKKLLTGIFLFYALFAYSQQDDKAAISDNINEPKSNTLK